MVAPSTPREAVFSSKDIVLSVCGYCDLPMLVSVAKVSPALRDLCHQFFNRVAQREIGEALLDSYDRETVEGLRKAWDAQYAFRKRIIAYFYQELPIPTAMRLRFSSTPQHLCWKAARAIELNRFSAAALNASLLVIADGEKRQLTRLALHSKTPPETQPLRHTNVAVATAYDDSTVFATICKGKPSMVSWSSGHTTFTHSNVIFNGAFACSRKRAAFVADDKEGRRFIEVMSQGDTLSPLGFPTFDRSEFPCASGELPSDGKLALSGNFLVSSHTSGAIHVWDLNAKGSQAKEPTQTLSHGWGGTLLATHGSRLATVSREKVQIWTQTGSDPGTIFSLEGQMELDSRRWLRIENLALFYPFLVFSGIRYGAEHECVYVDCGQLVCTESNSIPVRSLPQKLSLDPFGINFLKISREKVPNKASLLRYDFRKETSESKEREEAKS